MSSDLLDKLTEEAKALPEPEKRILALRLLEGTRPVLEEKREEVDEPSPDVVYRKREYRWMKEHKNEYAGQWVALDGDHLIAHGSSARKVLEEADKLGAKLPFIARVDSPDDLPFTGGWL
jgi:hypothetical protein